MADSIDIKPFDITCGEKVHYGYYAALEVVFNQYLNELESYFFDEFNTSLEFSYEILTGMKFRQFLDRIENPQPIFLFNLTPVIGDCLLIMENRSANLLLAQDNLHANRKTSISNQFSLNSDHSVKIQGKIDKLLSLFSNCWENILPVSSTLQKLVSNKIKARIMSPVEGCVTVRVTLKQNQFSTYWEFCFSDYQLDQVIKKYGSKLLLTGDRQVRKNKATKQYFSELLLNESQFSLTGVLGDLNISEQDLLDSYHNQTVIPIQNEISNNAVITVNDKPLLSASIGISNDHVALQVNGKYDRKKVEEKEKQKSFSKIHFPNI